MDYNTWSKWCIRGLKKNHLLSLEHYIPENNNKTQCFSSFGSGDGLLPDRNLNITSISTGNDENPERMKFQWMGKIFKHKIHWDM